MGARRMTQGEPHEAASLREISLELDRVAPGAPLLALGQTPLWDEPMKAVVACGISRPMVAGIHDLDYFSRVRAALPGPAWRALPRNDGATRDVWVAAGEISALFGAEVWPSRRALAEAGVRLERILPEGHCRQETFDRLTEAWGWRGIVGNTPSAPVVCETPAREVAPALLELLRWASRQTQRLLMRAEARSSVRISVGRIADCVNEFVSERPSASVGELFLHLLRGFYEGLLGAAPGNVAFLGARELLAFNRRTAAEKPRFRFVSQFLDERLSAACRAAYDGAVEESSMARLAESGEGALPFDIFAPGRGRGTLRVTPGFVGVDFPQPARWPLSRPIRDVQDLAAVLEDALGGDIALLGKALVLPAMLSAEFVMVFHEGASAYLPRTRRMLAAMRDAGVPIDAHPVLRMRLRTWDSMSACRASLRLPEHLAQAFGRRTLDCGEFSRCWRRAVKEEERLLHDLRQISSACDLVRYLGHEQHEAWFRRLRQCMEANALLLNIQKRADALRHKALDLRSREDVVGSEIGMLEARRGELNRSRIRPLRRRLAEQAADVPAGEGARLRAGYEHAEREGQALLLALETKQKERRRLREKRSAVGRQLRALERGRRAAAARRLLRSVERAADKARLRLARNAVLASEGLPHADLRPSAWWFPALDPSGRWFERVRRTASFRLEPLLEGVSR